MNESSSHPSDAAMAARQQTLNRQQTQAGRWLLVAVTVVVLFILPQYLAPPYDSVSMGFGAASILTAYFCLYPESLRSRGGSLVPALCLVVALWASAVVTTALLLFG